VLQPRRLRESSSFRDLVAETKLSPSDLILPLFVRSGHGEKRPVASMPGVFQYSSDLLVDRAKEAASLGIKGTLLFGIPDVKDDRASGAYDAKGVVQEAVRRIKEAVPSAVVITDVCLCAFMSHGHCGVAVDEGGRIRIDNAASLELLAQTAVSHARAGADMVAPSAMMDDQVRAIRQALTGIGMPRTPILSYAAKYASSMYGPFREAAESPPRFGDRASYQMDPRNADEALREIGLDIEQGADMVMVKPALAYLDVIRRAKDRFGHPMAAYNVSGEYSMVKAAAERGWIDERAVALEILTSIRRAGADLVITYWALDAARWLSGMRQ
jgi:porphobilinogen synthase